jgi:hypothetical protein
MLQPKRPSDADAYSHAASESRRDITNDSIRTSLLSLKPRHLGRERATIAS